MSTKRPPSSPTTADAYWVTRDENGLGVLSDEYHVWRVRPVRGRLSGGGCAWLGPGITGIEDRIAAWTREECLRQCRTAPDTSRECIVVGEPPAS